MGATTLVTVEEYLRSSHKPNAEYREGVVYPKPMPTTLHGMLEYILVAMLIEQGVQAAAEVSLRITPERFLIPDVVAAPVLRDPYPSRPVLLCCEILSPEDRLVSMLAKCEEYHAWDVPYCWVIDPIKRTGWEYHANEDPKPVDPLRAGTLSVRLEDLFARLPNRE